jgi:hypothetical protein
MNIAKTRTVPTPGRCVNYFFLLDALFLLFPLPL